MAWVAWLNGERDHVPGFVSQREARRWIEEQSSSVVVGPEQSAPNLIWPSRPADRGIISAAAQPN